MGSRRAPSRQLQPKPKPKLKPSRFPSVDSPDWRRRAWSQVSGSSWSISAVPSPLPTSLASSLADPYRGGEGEEGQAARLRPPAGSGSNRRRRRAPAHPPPPPLPPCMRRRSCTSRRKASMTTTLVRIGLISQALPYSPTLNSRHLSQILSDSPRCII
jgi:hypothetical protein